MIRLLLPIAALLCGIALLLLGTGLLNTLLALRGSAEQFSDQTLGLLGSAYFAGFILGTWLCPRLIRRMGHVRAFTFLAGVLAAHDKVKWTFCCWQKQGARHTGGDGVVTALDDVVVLERSPQGFRGGEVQRKDVLRRRRGGEGR